MKELSDVKAELSEIKALLKQTAPSQAAETSSS
jgi:hypothetical protein